MNFPPAPEQRFIHDNDNRQFRHTTPHRYNDARDAQLQPNPPPFPAA